MDLKSARKRVQTAVLLYLATFLAINLYVWVSFTIHRHGAHLFPLGERSERFGDLVLFSGSHQVGANPRLANFNGLNGTLFPRNYPPFAVVIYLFLFKFCTPYAIFALLLPVLAAVGTACAIVWRTVRPYPAYRWYFALAIFLTGLFGWGTEQVVMRGNIEGLVWISVCAGAAFYARRRFRSAAVAFGVATCIKPYPILWLVLMLRLRKYREVVLGLVTMIAVTLASLLVVDRNPVRAFHHISGASTFFEDYVVSFRPMGEMKMDHSLFQSIKTCARIVRNHGFNLPPSEFTVQANDPLAWKLYHLYLPLAVVIGLVAAWRLWNKPLLNQIFALACVTAVLPMVASDYTLTVLLIPMGFFLRFLVQDVAEARVGLSLRTMLWFLLPCAWIMSTSPLTVLHGVFNCVAILILLGASISVPLPSTLFGELDGLAID